MVRTARSAWWRCCEPWPSEFRSGPRRRAPPARRGTGAAKLLGNARSELFHYEVRSTYDTPEVAESRRIVDEAQRRLDEPTFDSPTTRTLEEGLAGMKRFYLMLGC